MMSSTTRLPHRPPHGTAAGTHSVTSTAKRQHCCSHAPLLLRHMPQNASRMPRCGSATQDPFPETRAPSRPTWHFPNADLPPSSPQSGPISDREQYPPSAQMSKRYRPTAPRAPPHSPLLPPTPDSNSRPAPTESASPYENHESRLGQ